MNQAPGETGGSDTWTYSLELSLSDQFTDLLALETYYTNDTSASVVLLAEVENEEVHCKITAITATGRGGFALLQVTLIIPLLLSPSVVLSSNTTGAEGKPETLNPKTLSSHNLL